MPDPRCLQCARRVPYVSLGGNTSLAVYKIIVGTLGGSSALVVDGLHSSSDVIGSITILVVSRISGKPPDESHPYGHAKAEFIGSMIVFTILLFLSIGIMIGAALVIARGKPDPPHVVTLLGAIVSVLVNYFMHLYGYCAGTRCNSPALLADAFENRADAISSLAAVVGIGAALWVHPMCDPIAAFVVGAIILHGAIEQLVGSSAALMDRGLPAEVVDRLREMASRHAGVSAVEYVKTRQTGTRFWVDVGIRVANGATVVEADAVAASVRVELMERCEELQHVEVFVVPDRAPIESAPAAAPAIPVCVT